MNLTLADIDAQIAALYVQRSALVAKLTQERADLELSTTVLLTELRTNRGDL